MNYLGALHRSTLDGKAFGEKRHSLCRRGCITSHLGSPAVQEGRDKPEFHPITRPENLFKRRIFRINRSGRRPRDK
jgi:hypothetical protein